MSWSEATRGFKGTSGSASRSLVGCVGFTLCLGCTGVTHGTQVGKDNHCVCYLKVFISALVPFSAWYGFLWVELVMKVVWQCGGRNLSWYSVVKEGRGRALGEQTFFLDIEFTLSTSRQLCHNLHWTIKLHQKEMWGPQ
ncbi:hypothetical protein EYF80_029748 [Liparis tanakae]|uniref:Uncharacterized protein n=1 Tax=Liparis tanakae TaxID=230148 RepID=A0A4Z2H2T3_9TELE|nr:hypothetical protein EYF80_029748 [Liparis tanakae]